MLKIYVQSNIITDTPPKDGARHTARQMNLPPLPPLVHLPAQAAVSTPAKFEVTQNIKGSFQTGVYVVAVHPTTNELHFGFGRKVPPKRRTPYKGKGRGLTGAAGTAPKYYGKWASLGGGSDPKASTPLQAAVIELFDEAYLREFYPKGVSSKDDVWIPWKTPKKPASKLLFLLEARKVSGAFIFLFQMKWDRFKRLFPNVDDPAVRGGQAMVTASHGEIDSTASFTLTQMFNYQAKSRKDDQDNYFTNYTLDSFVSVVLPALSKAASMFASPTVQSELAQARGALPLIVGPDKAGRDPSGRRDKQIYKK
mgnify:CR=1 FL=1